MATEADTVTPTTTNTLVPETATDTPQNAATPTKAPTELAPADEQSPVVDDEQPVTTGYQLLDALISDTREGSTLRAIFGAVALLIVGLGILFGFVFRRNR